jgi:hypothetical protein
VVPVTVDFGVILFVLALVSKCMPVLTECKHLPCRRNRCLLWPNELHLPANGGDSFRQGCRAFGHEGPHLGTLSDPSHGRRLLHRAWEDELARVVRCVAASLLLLLPGMWVKLTHHSFCNPRGL